MKKIRNHLSTAALVVALVIGALFYGVKIFGVTPLVVTSGSMQPAIKTGSVIYIKQSKEYEVGDIISFKLNEDIIATHRIVSLAKTGYRTKGDANENEDAKPVQKPRVIGKVVATIPYLGYLGRLIELRMSKLVIIIFIIILLSKVIYDEISRKRRKV